MKNTGIFRIIDVLGRIVIPKEIRILMGIEEGSNVEIYVEGKEIVLEKAEKNSKKVGLFRMVDELGRIVIPKEIRERYNLNEGDAIEIWLDGNKIILRKYHTECIYCRSKNNIEKVLEKPVCKSCLTKIKKNIINI